MKVTDQNRAAGSGPRAGSAQSMQFRSKDAVPGSHIARRSAEGPVGFVPWRANNDQHQ